MAGRVRWEYYDHGWVAQSARVSDDLEMEFNVALGGGKPKVVKFQAGHWLYRADACLLVQENCQHQDGKVRSIRRDPSAPLPAGARAKVLRVMRLVDPDGFDAGTPLSQPDVALVDSAQHCVKLSTGQTVYPTTGTVRGLSLKLIDCGVMPAITCSICLMELVEPAGDAPVGGDDSPGDAALRLLPTKPGADPAAAAGLAPVRACCDHVFHAGCLCTALQHKPHCPNCKFVFEEPCGTMPDGEMRWRTDPRRHLAGHPGTGTIIVEYHFPSGVQEAQHYHPGNRYHGTNRTAFLPDNAEGREILMMFIKAFRRRLMFTVGTSVTTGRPDCVVWAGIHHKTNPAGGPQAFGYPDPTYYARVKSELVSAGVTL